MASHRTAHQPARRLCPLRAAWSLARTGPAWLAAVASLTLAPAPAMAQATPVQPAPAKPAAAEPASGARPSARSLPQRAPLKPALRDPFAGWAAATAPLSPAPMPVVPPPALPLAARAAAEAVAAPLAAAVPAPPALDLQFIGRLHLGTQTQVLAQSQGRAWVLTNGLELPTGYVVESVGPQEVLLRHPTLAYSTRWPLPAAPTFETH